LKARGRGKESEQGRGGEAENHRELESRGIRVNANELTLGASPGSNRGKKKKGDWGSMVISEFTNVEIQTKRGERSTLGIRPREGKKTLC